MNIRPTINTINFSQSITESKKNIMELTQLLMQNTCTGPQTSKSGDKLYLVIENITENLSEPHFFQTENPPGNSTLKRSIENQTPSNRPEKRQKIAESTTTPPEKIHESIPDPEERFSSEAYILINNRIATLVHQILEKAAIPTFNDESLVHLRSITHLISCKRRELEILIDYTKQNYDSTRYHFNLASPICLSEEKWKVFWDLYDSIMEIIPVCKQNKKMIDSIIKMITLILGSTKYIKNFTVNMQQYQKHQLSSILPLSDFLLILSDDVTLPEKLTYSLDEWMECFTVSQKLEVQNHSNPTFQASLCSLIQSSKEFPFVLEETLCAFQNHDQPHTSSIKLFVEKLASVPKNAQKMKIYSTSDWLEHFAFFEKLNAFLIHNESINGVRLREMFHAACASKAARPLLNFIKSLINPLQPEQCNSDETFRLIESYLLKINEISTNNHSENSSLNIILNTPDLINKLNKEDFDWKYYFNKFDSLYKYIAMIEMTEEDRIKINAMFHVFCCSPILSYFKYILESKSIWISNQLETLLLLSTVPEIENKIQEYPFELWNTYFPLRIELLNLDSNPDYQADVFKLMNNRSNIISALHRRHSEFMSYSSSQDILENHKYSTKEFVSMLADYPQWLQMQHCSLQNILDYFNLAKTVQNFISADFDLLGEDVKKNIRELIISVGINLPLLLDLLKSLKSDSPLFFEEYVLIVLKTPEFNDKLVDFSLEQFLNYIKSFHSILKQLSLLQSPQDLFKKFDSLDALNLFEDILKNISEAKKLDFQNFLLDCSSIDIRLRTYSLDQWNFYFNFYLTHIKNPHQDFALHDTFKCLYDSIFGVFLLNDIEKYHLKNEFIAHMSANLSVVRKEIEIGCLGDASNSPFTRMFNRFAFREKYLDLFSPEEKRNFFVPLCQLLDMAYRCIQNDKDDLWFDNCLKSIRQMPEFYHADESTCYRNILFALMSTPITISKNIEKLKCSLHFYQSYSKDVLEIDLACVNNMLYFIYNNTPIEFKRFNPVKGYEISYINDAKIQHFANIAELFNECFVTEDKFIIKTKELGISFFEQCSSKRINYLKIIICIFSRFEQNGSYQRLTSSQVISTMAKIPDFCSKWSTYGIIDWVCAISEHHKAEAKRR